MLVLGDVNLAGYEGICMSLGESAGRAAMSLTVLDMQIQALV